MQKICEVLGLSIGDITELFTCLSAIIMSSVFMGHCFFYAFSGLICLIGDMICALFKFAVRHFPNVRKTEKGE